MSTDTVIKVENLGKQYRIGAREGYKTFRETLVFWVLFYWVRLVLFVFEPENAITRLKHHE